jgi:hypothetical protein
VARSRTRPARGVRRFLKCYPRRLFGSVRADLCYNFNTLIQCAYKFRIDPNAEQRAQLAIEFGHNRFVGIP